MVAEDLDAERTAWRGIGPAAPPTAWPPFGIHQAAPWLRARLGFIVEQPWVGEFSEQVGSLVRTSRAFLEPRHVRRVPCGPCGEVVHGPALEDQAWPVPCPGVLIARLGDDVEDSRDPACDWCGTVVTIDHTAALKRGMAELLSTVEVADAVGVPAGTVRWWAHAGKLRRQGTDASGRTLYMLDHVQALADARQVEQESSA
jgi:hypothetical protein